MAPERARGYFRAERWQLDYLFDLGFQAWLVHVGVVAATAGVLVNAHPEDRWPLLWCAAMVLLSLSLSLLARFYVRRPPAGDEAARRFGVAHTSLTFLVGIAWGLGAFGAATGEFENLLIYSLALGGTALGAVSSQHVLPRSCFVSLWTSVPLLGLAHLFHEPAFLGAVVMGMVLLYAAILSILAVHMLRFMRANVALARSLDARLAELTQMAAELEQARAEAVEANLSKSRFLAHASHDLRQPIHAIGLFAACLRDLDLGAEAAKLVGSVDNAARSVSRLLGSLLDISRLDVGGIVPQPEPLALGELLQGIARQNADIAEANGCTLRIVPTTLWVEADPALLSAMVQNLLSNALKYAPQARILIGARRAGGSVAIEVVDTGPGIAEKDFRRIFDEFFRADRPAVRATEGLGLGLAIVRRLAELTGLDVAAASVPGRGTRLRISGLRPVAPVAEAVSRARRQHPLTGLRVCLIDDDAEVLSASAILLRRWGCEVAAFRALPAGTVGCDAIVSDFDLGGETDGLDAIAAIRAAEGWDVPAAIVSGRSEPETLARLARAGIPFLRKPVHPAELRALLTGFALDAALDIAGEAMRV
ncbi:MAG: ATP-binding protein [Parvibaculum sp.]|uniref:hybrid sensor histidine kinase/response regulator n=1 Tax=Parvibaculum sp. TaxID=2024848 RepID=UPI00271D7197|nr:ATP-binding protein [Parvibaculum sp.]MDO8837503.1 ATP-binding protein [Parvibaculum sp.]